MATKEDYELAYDFVISARRQLEKVKDRHAIELQQAERVLAVAQSNAVQIRECWLHDTVETADCFRPTKDE